MNSNLISKLKTLIEESGNKDRIMALEDSIAGEIEEFVKEESFYEIPTNEILKIVEKSEFGDIKIICELASRMSENKGEESTLLLNVIKTEEATLEECIKILSKFEHSPLCKRTSELFNEDKKQPEVDYEHEIDELKKENEELQKKTKGNKTYFPPVTEEPSDFEDDIHDAAEEGKLTSVQYLIEQCRADAEEKDGFGCTPLMWASDEGHLDIVKYLYEVCHANVETKDIHGYTSINYAAIKGHLEVVKYLHETCHANVETKDDFGWTPINYASANGYLDVVKYLYETCHADIETKNNDGRTPISSASRNGQFEVVKYLYEKCYVKITEETIKIANTKEIKDYLLSKIIR